MPYRDLREFLDALERKRLLRRVTAEVDRDLEISEITDRVSKAGGPALLFQQVKGHTVPLAINLYGSAERMALALEVSRLDDLSRKVQDILDLAMHPPKGMLDKVKTL